MQIKDKVVIITGSGQGLGKAFATKLLEEGAKVCLSDVNNETGLKTLQEFANQFGQEKVHFIRCDVRSSSDLCALFDGCESYFKGSVDIFCNNAGINHVPGWRLCMDIDIMSVFEGTELAMSRMDVSKGGRGGLIVNTASLAGIVCGFSVESACYFVAKHGVVSLTRTLGKAEVLSRTGVKVQCICPSFADTAILSDLDNGAKDKIDAKFGIMTPEFVADGFIKLIKYGENGAAIAVMKDAPPFFYTDHARESIIFHAISAKIIHKMFGTELVTARHEIALVLSMVVIFNLLLFILFN